MCGGGVGKQIFDVAAPIVLGAVGGEFLAPALEGLEGLGEGSALAFGEGTALGSGAGGLIAGEKPLQALETAGIGGVTAGISSELGGGTLLGGGQDISSLFSGTGGAVPTAPNANPSIAGAGAPGVTGGTAIGGPTSGAAPAPAGLGTDVPNADITLAGGSQPNAVNTLLGANSPAAQPGAAGAPTNDFGNLANTASVAGAPGANAAGGTSGGAFNSLLKSLTPGSAVAGAGLIGDAIKGTQLAKGERQLQQEAGQLAGQGTQLSSYLQNGTLPPGVQNSITAAADAQKASIRSRYASEGSSGSSAEQQDLASVDNWAQGEGAQTALGLLQQGVNETGLASQLYQDIANKSIQSDTALSSALANFGASLGGGTSNQKYTLQPTG